MCELNSATFNLVENIKFWDILLRIVLTKVNSTGKFAVKDSMNYLYLALSSFCMIVNLHIVLFSIYFSTCHL